ncbi:1-(5-phosphoribosyl)-5-[(5-phosphoribosylamino)methylideneamino]imidazole-4-carboxamide isomerase [Fulvivirga sediminis]|uniref:1-(5-phosphoribosyl)-5-[(5-phosphoribosylamino)methylideneamino] imidazole-4-carboxamide isomerase n=1 Tax=Fulvivirga sediminis TaxID=2803949 RepID=A0A937FDB5_9BACT|nr:1-(5-phosphoribosyl)-5-[(5-phosphoribosylamino)methylideneamino]imidazole-4-carboxamide isomerase [Fulvivirga sediminis]MBL3658669.1 1-(5-phosphoribosyl)-5-[(5-phosphoribosylamino)methylideneamino]imidazole-4-carboxamide isomerase [Fulvivirga sediminis]
MRIIPAIDIIDGKCVRLTQGDYDQKKIYNEDPLEVAKSFEDAGLQYLHLVDLDGAKAGKVINTEVLAKITSNTSLVVDFGGGIKTNADIEKVFDNGAAKVTCGSIAIKNPTKVSEWLEKYGSSKLILGADVKDRMISVSGWTEQTTLSIEDLLHKYLDDGLEEVICTDIATDGMLTGPNLRLYQELLNIFPNIKLIASGGVSNIDDLKALKAAGLEGAILGKAIYEGKVTLKELNELQNA